MRRIFHQFPQLKTILLIVSGVLVLDQITKILARIYLAPLKPPEPYVKILGDFFRLTYVENPGIAFGIRVNNKIVFTILSIMALIFIFYYLFKMRENLLFRLAFSIILGGALGNLIDRFFYGKVVDFLDFEFFNITIPSFKFLFLEFQNYSLDRWPVFNIADSAVTIGMILIIMSLIFDREKNSVDAHVVGREEV
ncbi:MAG: signal peptidase II [Calditrichia bacterium]